MYVSVYVYIYQHKRCFCLTFILVYLRITLHYFDYKEVNQSDTYKLLIWLFVNQRQPYSKQQMIFYQTYFRDQHSSRIKNRRICVRKPRQRSRRQKCLIVIWIKCVFNKTFLFLLICSLITSVIVWRQPCRNYFVLCSKTWKNAQRRMITKARVAFWMVTDVVNELN